MNDTEKELQKVELSLPVRFMHHVVQSFGSGVGDVALTNFQKRLAQNYFMAVDEALLKQEQKRNAQKEPAPCVWANVNMERLARDVVSFSRIGLDPNENNHISPVLYKNNKTGKYDVGFIPRYNGIELKARKYGLECPDIVIVELVHQKDHFKIFKKSADNPIERYEFEIREPFDRGEIIGGFYYHGHINHPQKNLVVAMSKKDIDKRKPQYASAEFWGGEKPVWKDNKKVGTEQADGWYEKMAYKTVYRAAYSAITIDSQKIDDDYRRLSAAENMGPSPEFEAEYKELANSELLLIEVDHAEAIDGIQPPPEGEQINPETGEVITNTAHHSAPMANDQPPFPVG